MADDVTSGTGTNGVLSPGQSVFKSIEFNGDNDWFKVELVAGTSYLFTMRGADTNDGTLANPFLQLRNSAGTNVVASDNNSGIGLNCELIYVATQTGTYYLDASSNNDSGTGVYSIGMEAQIDPPGNKNTSIELDAFYSARPDLIERPADKDWYRVELEAGVPYFFDMVGLGYRGSVPDGKLVLYRQNNDGTVTQIKANDNGGFDKDARIVYTPTKDGTYYLEASSADGGIGFYWMYVAPATGANYLDSLIPVHDQWWPPDIGVDKTTITWNFMALQPSYAYGDDTVGFAALDVTHRQAVDSALLKWEELTNIDFVYVGDAEETAMLRFGSNHGGSSANEVAGYAYFPDQDPEDHYGSDVYFNSLDGSFGDVTPGSYGYLVILHEIGHALGLKHPGEYSAHDMLPFLPAADDSRLNTVMSYNEHPSTGFEPTTPMLYDIDAIQYLYGPNMAFKSGNTPWTFSTSTEQLFSIWDAGGVDTFDCSDQTSRVIIDLREFHMSSVGPKTGGGLAVDNIGIANGTIIEKAIGGSGADLITGNQVKNTLTGGGGGDTLIGGGNADLLRGGDGKDVIVWDTADVTVAGALQGGAMGDTLRLDGGGKTLNLTNARNDALVSIEFINIIGTGNNILKLAAGDVTAMNSAGEIFVRANSGDRCMLSGPGWSLAGSETIGGVFYDHFVNINGASLYWDAAGVDIVI